MNYDHGTEQGAGGTHVDITSAADVHIVPDTELHEVTIIAMSDTTTTVTTKINGEANGVIESVTANEQKAVLMSAIVLGTAGGSAVNCVAGAGTVASARAKVKVIHEG